MQKKAGEVFFGTKQVVAWPMTRQAYNDYRDWTLPDDENGDDEGYLIEYVEGGRGNHPDHLGYISWSPKEVFYKEYTPTGAMSFGHALVAMEQGLKVARAGWNGKGMWVAWTPGSTVPLQSVKPGSALALLAAERIAAGDLSELTICGHYDMKAADGSLVIGWLASQTDMAAKDWGIVP